jgi:polysaccharide export outer membrane protein
MKNKSIKRVPEIVLAMLCVIVFSPLAFAQDSANQAQNEVNSGKQAVQSEKSGAQKKYENRIKKEEYGEYTLGQDDIIDISVRRHTEFSGRFTVGVNGRIQYPFVGDIELTGLTKTEAVEKVKDVLAQYIESPEVDITIVEYNSKVVYMVGQVARPGRYSMRAQFMPVREAVLVAGLPRENIASLRRAIIIRPLENGKTVVKKINLLSLLYDGKLELNYDLRSGDIVYLPSTALYKVSTIMEQIVSPFFQSSSAYNTWETDVLYRDQPRRN